MWYTLNYMNMTTEISEASAAKHLGSSLGYLRSVPLFSNLSDEEIACFDRVAQIRSYKKGKIIFLQSETPKFFYIIVGGGWIKLFRTMPEGDEVIVDMLTAGHMFGESAIFEQDCQMSSAQVVEAVSLLSIPASMLKEQIRTCSKLALNMLSSMSRHHRHHVSAMAFNTMLSAPQRIGCFLLQLCPPGDNRINITFNLPYDKTLIADTLGMKGATFSRALNILRLKTKIRIDGSCIIVESVPLLARYVYGATGTNYISADM
jgi:CRP/FNR family transcriptional regulator, dissimilatory nitrate respiration regulator